MKIRIDRELCQGLGNCVAIAPKAFRLDAENKVFVADPAGADEKKLMQAAESCPYDAIIIEDDTGNQLYP
ncbi:MAG TPA: ferredoxin [Dehalococcoidia bacterium]|nr:ferredoxin [Dehalococcoidia bacterium]